MDGKRGWSDGFLKTVREQGLYYQAPIISETRQYWTQDNETDPNVLNPRLSKIEKGLKPEVSGTDKVVTTEYTYALPSDFSGNVKETREYAFGQWGLPGTLRRKTELTYLHETSGAYTALNIVDRVTSTTVRNNTLDPLDPPNTQKIAKTSTTYDQLPLLSSPTNATRHDPAFGLGYTTRGLPNTVSKWHDITGNLYINTSTQYDEFGNPRIATDGRNYSTTMNYGSSGSYAFPLQVINPKGHVTQATYSYVGGVVLTQTDANNKTTTSTYDHLWRISLVTKPDGGTRTHTYYVGCTSYVSIVEAVTSTTTRTRTAKLDSMGRFQEKDVSDPIGGTICQENEYNSMSQVSSSSLPSRHGQPVYSNTYEYIASRLFLNNFPDGSRIIYNYDLNTTTVTNQGGKKRKYSYQEDGKVNKVTEEDSSGQLTVETNYVYDPMARLITITQGSQTRTFTYDALGRLLTEKHPESSLAGEANKSYTYTYDANSNIETKTDARGITVTLIYDELNRVIEKKHGAVTVAAHSYDSQPGGSPISIQNPIGRITKVTTTTGGVTATNYYSYCNCSAVGQEATVIQDGTTKTYTTSYAYNYVGGITSITYPNGRIVNYTRDSVGRETKVSSTLYGYPVMDYVRSASYLGPQGGLTQIEYGMQNGLGNYVRTNITYSAMTMRMTNLQTFGVNLNYFYQTTGHIYKIDDVYAAGQGYDFQYDRWYRLTSFTRRLADPETTDPNITYTYDNYGNILSTNRNGYINNFSVNPLTNRLNGTGYVYDAAGNMTGRPGSVTRTFDAENRLISTTEGNLNFLYDGNSRRLRKMAGTSKIYFIYSSTGKLLVEDNWTAVTSKDHIYFNGQLIATRTEADYVRLFFKDHLGSTRSVVKIDPVIVDFYGWGTSWMTVQYFDWNPYGEIRSGGGDPDGATEKFTGKERDSGSNLDYFGARYYDGGRSYWDNGGATFRWISADSVMQRPNDPASHNKYSYARNDPINMIDRDGRFWVWVCSLKSYDPFLDGDGNYGLMVCFPMWIEPPPPPGVVREPQICGVPEKDYFSTPESLFRIGDLKVAMESVRRLLTDKTSDCYKNLPNVLKWFADNFPGNKLLWDSPESLLALLQGKYRDNMIRLEGERTSAFLCKGSRRAAGVGAGSWDTIYLGWHFFHDDDFDRVTALMHETFHLGNDGYHPPFDTQTQDWRHNAIDTELRKAGCVFSGI